MNRTTAFSLVVLGIAAGSSPVAAMAADEDVQLWLTGTAVVPLGENVSGTFDLSRRIREDDDQLLLRGNADFKVSKSVSIGGGAAYVDSIDGLLETGDDTEIRLQQQISLTFGAISFRTRLEERFFHDADRMQLRVRQRIQASAPLTRGLRGAISAELFYVARSEDADGDDGKVSQWRLNATLTHKLSDHVDVTGGYLLMVTPRTGAPDQIDHVPQLTLTYRP